MTTMHTSNPKVRAFNNANPGLLPFLAEASERNSFAASLVSQLNSRGSLSEKQIAAALKMRETIAAPKKEPKAAAEVDLSAIHAMFDKARDAGLKRLAYRAEGLVISPASANGMNAGGLYVKTTDDTYIGKIMGTKFIATNAANDEHKTALEVIAANPADAAKAYGIKTGICSCCGRELTDPSSIAAGIGPICATKWGF